MGSGSKGIQSLVPSELLTGDAIIRVVPVIFSHGINEMQALANLNFLAKSYELHVRRMRASARYTCAPLSVTNFPLHMHVTNCPLHMHVLVCYLLPVTHAHPCLLHIARYTCTSSSVTYCLLLMHTLACYLLPVTYYPRCMLHRSYKCYCK
jgi:hypothetical protein